MPIRVLIADDHALLRQGIKGVLDFESDIEVVGETEDGQETLARTLVLQPDVLLLDLNMPGLSGMEVCKQLAAARCHVKIIALTIHDNDNYVLELAFIYCRSCRSVFSAISSLARICRKRRRPCGVKGATSG